MRFERRRERRFRRRQFEPALGIDVFESPSEDRTRVDEGLRVECDTRALAPAAAGSRDANVERDETRLAAGHGPLEARARRLQPRARLEVDVIASPCRPHLLSRPPLSDFLALRHVLSFFVPNFRLDGSCRQRLCRRLALLERFPSSVLQLAHALVHDRQGLQDTSFGRKHRR